MLNQKEYAHIHYLEHKESYKWLGQYGQDYLELIKRYSVCVCCGEQAEQLDHIIAINSRELNHAGKVNHLYDFLKGRLQPICKQCNHSKTNGLFCKVHNTYLGIWNYLPKLNDLDKAVFEERERGNFRT